MKDNHRPRPSPALLRPEAAGGELAQLLERCGRCCAHHFGGGHRGQERVLVWLARHPEATQKELSEGLGVTPASLSEVLRKLERKGFVARVKDETDRRFTRVRLTAEGERVLHAQSGRSGDPFACLSPEEQELLKRLLGKLLADWETRRAREPERREPGPLAPRGGEHPGQDGQHPGRPGERRGHGPH